MSEGKRKGMATEQQIRSYWASRLWKRKGFDSEKEFLQQGSCFACGFDGGLSALERAHIVAINSGGANSAENLHMLCKPCHRNSEALSGLRYWRWFLRRSIVDRLYYDAMQRGYNPWSTLWKGRKHRAVVRRIRR